MFTLLHIEDDPMHADAVARIVRAVPGIRHVGTVRTGAEGISLARERAPDIILLDLLLPDLDGFDVVDELARLTPLPKILVLSCRLDDYAVWCIGRAPVCGMVAKGARMREQLAAALDTVIAGGTYFSPEIREARRWLHADPHAFFKLLSEHQIALLPLLGAGWSNDEIARRANLAPSTVQNHRHDILRRLGLPSTVALVRWCAQKGFTRSSPSTRPGGTARPPHVKPAD